MTGRKYVRMPAGREGRKRLAHNVTSIKIHKMMIMIAKCVPPSARDRAFGKITMSRYRTEN